MKTFTFNNKNSYEDLGLIILKSIYPSRAAEDIEEIEIPRRNGSLHICSGKYKNKQQSIECLIIDPTKQDLIKKTLKGQSKLKLSDYPNIQYDVTVMDEINFEKYDNNYLKLEINFSFSPFAESVVEQNIDITETSTINVLGNANCYPILKATGTGTFYINDILVKINESDIDIDCLLQNCTKNNIDKNDKVEIEEFAFLIPGDNSIIINNGITNLNIKYREGWL